MAPNARRFVGWIPLVTLLAVWPAAWFVSQAGAEERRFVVFLADLPKDAPGPRVLPNPARIYEAYFDHVLNGQNGGPRTDSFAEWYDEVSYGEVSVSGAVLGWVQPPWPSQPDTVDGQFPDRVPHVELQGGGGYSPGQGEGFSAWHAKYKFDFDGVGVDDDWGNRDAVDVYYTPQFADVPGGGFMLLWLPGERFQDLNGNRIYDAGVPEWAIDKNGDGIIQVDKQAGSWAELVAASITYPPEGSPQGTPPVFNSWLSDAEWFDSNGDGQWAADGPEYPYEYAPDGHIAYRGDWGGTEIWWDRRERGVLGERAAPADQAQGRASLSDFIFQVNDPEKPEVEWFDEQWNNNFDFPEPFEDFMRRWDAGEHSFVPVDVDYINSNYPTDTTYLISRMGSRRYDAPNEWSNNNNVNSSNKLQEVFALLSDSAEASEQIRRDNYFTPEPSWLQESWNDRYGTDPPSWTFWVPYLRKFNPGEPIPPTPGNPTPTMPFEPNGGGPDPLRPGKPFKTTPFTGIVLPNISDAADGMYDGDAEYDDVASSIYHRAGDGNMGEVTSPTNIASWGEDLGAGPDAPSFHDFIIPAAGPLAFNVHGYGGYDAGNQLNLEYLTWRTDGRNLTDVEVDVSGTGFFTQFAFHRDINLDGMVDLGETVGVPGEFGLPDRHQLHNYGMDPYIGGKNDGDPGENEYPYNRVRLLEDLVAALDDTTDWDAFLGAPGPLGELISGIVLLSDRSPTQMLRLPASPHLSTTYLSMKQANYPPDAQTPLPRIRTRDHVNPGVTGRAYYDPIVFFDGLGTVLGAAEVGGEPGAPSELFATAFAAHEYGHMWEGFPDLYDYDVTGDNPSKIVNYPVGRWCIMAVGGLIHPVPILKAAGGYSVGGIGGRVPWITPVDITRMLQPLAPTTLTLRTWEFDRDKTVFVYQNPIFAGEEFWFWRNSPGAIQSGQVVRQAFDIRQPGWGVLIMHVDRHSNPQGVPEQQRIGSHFTYEMVQGDGKDDLQNGDNTGDDGDPWPGSAQATVWNGSTIPNNKWWDGTTSCGLEIMNIVENANSSDVTFVWTPRELPTLQWMLDPNAVSVSGLYPLRYRAYDQHGGTKIHFYAFRNLPGQPLGYDFQYPLGTATKVRGEVDGVFSAGVRDLPDGIYTFYAQLEPGTGPDGVAENSWSVPRPSINNIGNGTLVVNGVDPNISKLERWTVTCIDQTTPNAETWQVVGSISGAQTALAFTGTPYASDPDTLGRVALHLTLTPGPFPFRLGDSFIFLTTGLTEHSSALLVDDGEVVKPEKPHAVARLASGYTTGLAPLTVTFKHDQSTDPHGATLTFAWDFGDNTDGYTTQDLDRPVTHTYQAAGTYNATLTVTNAFGLSDQDTIGMLVSDAQPPTVRLSAAPLSGAAPLRVEFQGDLTTDPNPDVQGLDFIWDFGDGSPPATNSREIHTYPDPGIYVVTLTVTNRPYGKSAAATTEIRVTGTGAGNQPPVAVITVNRLFGQAPLAVSFDGNTSYDPEGGALEYAWDFGDGSAVVRGVSSVDHTFTKPGTYQTTLTVTDDAGNTKTATIAIVATGSSIGGVTAPLAAIRASATQGPAPFTVTFDGTPSSDPAGGKLSYGWDFGDGSSQVLGDFPVVEHTFTTPRDYSVVLTVLNAAGASGSASVKISVTSPAGGGGGGGGTGGGTTQVPVTCGAGCGPVGLMPMLLTLIGIGGLRRFRGRLY